jgi:hypothetical protein
LLYCAFRTEKVLRLRGAGVYLMPADGTSPRM